MAQRSKRKAEDALLLALACGASVDQAARQCGLCSRTVYRRLAEAEFRQRLQALRGDMVSRTAGTLTAAATEAVRTLLELLKSPVAAAVRLSAARAVLEFGMKVREASDLEERVAALEKAAAEDAKERR
jgi:hypothetical protein